MGVERTLAEGGRIGMRLQKVGRLNTWQTRVPGMKSDARSLRQLPAMIEVHFTSEEGYESLSLAYEDMSFLVPFSVVETLVAQARKGKER